MPNKITIPSIRVDRVFKLRDKIREGVLSKYVAKTIKGDQFNELVDKILNLIPSVERHILERSIQHIAGVHITKNMCVELAWRIAGNVRYLEKGCIVPPYTQQLFEEWVPVHVVAAERCAKKVVVNKESGATIHKPYVRVTFQVMAGLPAGKRIVKIYPESFFFSRKRSNGVFGFDKRDRAATDRYYVGNSNFPFHNVMQLTRLRFWVKLSPAESDYGQPNFKDIDNSSAFKSWNRKLMKRRARLTFKCPKNYDVHIRPCHECEIGYDQCMAGCHPSTYVIKNCPRCKQPNKNFLNANATICVDCLAREPYN